MLLSCNKEPLQPAPGTDVACAVRIDPLITKVTETNFENGDAIGLTISRESGVWAENEKLVYDGSVFAGTLKWYSESADEATLVAYHPYSATLPTSFTVASDQTQGTSSSDLVAALKSGVLPSANAVLMTFSHKLSRVVVNVTNNAGHAIDGITFGGSIPTAVLAEDFSATVDETETAPTADIALFKASETQYQAVVVPQTVAFVAKVTVAGTEMSQNLASATLIAGKQYTINMTVNPADIQITLSGEVTNWDDGGEIGGEGTDEIVFEEHLSDNYIIWHNDRYSVKQLSNGRWIMTQSMRYVPAGKTVSEDPADGNGIWYPYTSDGTTASADKSAAAIEARGLLYDHQVAFGAEITADNFKTFEGCQGICPTGWHIPTRAEFLAIVGASNKADGETASTTDETAVYYDATYQAARIKTMNDDGFNMDFAGSLMRNNNTTTGRYLATVTQTGKCSVESWLGRNAVTYYMGSTGYTPSNTATNRQFMSLMTTFSSTYLEGKMHVAYSNYLGGYSLRCIRDAE